MRREYSDVQGCSVVINIAEIKLMEHCGEERTFRGARLQRGD